LFIDDIASYFQKSADKRRATRYSSLNDDIITRIITRTAIESGTHRLGEGTPEA